MDGRSLARYTHRLAWPSLDYGKVEEFYIICFIILFKSQIAHSKCFRYSKDGTGSPALELISEREYRHKF